MASITPLAALTCRCAHSSARRLSNVDSGSKADHNCDTGGVKCEKPAALTISRRGALAAAALLSNPAMLALAEATEGIQHCVPSASCGHDFLLDRLKDLVLCPIFAAPLLIAVSSGWVALSTRMLHYR